MNNADYQREQFRMTQATPTPPSNETTQDGPPRMPPLESGIESRHRLVLRALAEAKKLMEDLQLARAAGPTGKMKVRLLHARQL